MSRTKKFHLLISGLFVANAVLILGVCVAAYIHLERLNSSLLEQKHYAEALSEKETNLFALSNQFERVQESAHVIDNTLPEEKEASKLITDLNSISEKSGLKFTAIRSDLTRTKIEDPDPALLQTQRGRLGQEMPLTIDVSGTYPELVSFVKSLENYQRLLNINSVDIKRTNTEGGGDEVEATIKMVVYIK